MMNTEYRILKFVITLLCCPVAICYIAGCQNAQSKKSSPDVEIEQLRQENTKLTRLFEQTKAENEQLKKQLQVLAGIPGEVKPENIYDLQSIKITRYTNLYDKDKDGKKETLIVYIQPIDQNGDIIKAGGDVSVQLWDLNAPEPGKTLLGQWDVKPDELKKLWFSTILTINYRLTFDVSDKIKDPKDPLTVKVTFTDHLTGKVFKEQREIKPQIP